MKLAFWTWQAPAARFLAVGACLLLPGCSGTNGTGPAAEEPAAEVVEIVRGTLLPGENWLFRTCGGATELPLQPGDIVVRNLLDELGRPGRELYVEMEGRVGGRVPTMTMTRLHYAAIDTLGCAAVQVDAEFRAQGNEPFWSVNIDATRATWRTPERLEGTGFAITGREDVGDGILLSAVTDTETMEIAFAATACRDTMADAWYGYTVQVQIDEQIYYGCGRRGGAR